MVSTEKVKYIDAGVQDMSRPKERSPKTNWKIEVMKKALSVMQHVSPHQTTKLIWQQMSKTGKSRITEKQQETLDKAEVKTMHFMNHEITTYRWGTGDRKVLLAHGWNSKTLDFRRMIESFVESGFSVYGLDLKGHGQSEGTHTTVPEVKDLLKDYYISHGPFDVVIGYSMGGLASGIMLSELSQNFHPEHFFIIAAPSHTRYFFRDMIDALGYTERIYKTLCNMVEETYHQSIDYYDLRSKTSQLKGIDLHLIYDETDKTVEMKRGLELKEAYPGASFVHTKGIGHYKIIAYHDVIEYVVAHSKEKFAVYS